MTEPKPRSALVTGGGTGIGFAIAQTLAHSGFNLTLVGRRGDVLSKAAASLRGRPGLQIRTDAADLGIDEHTTSIIERHRQQFDGLDLLVCAAGVYEQIAFLDLTPASWDRTFNINFRGNFLTALAAARIMKSQGGGRIVFIGSVLAEQSEPLTSAYSASKAAMASLVRSMAVDLAGTGVVVNAVNPGWVRTAMTIADVDSQPAAAMTRINPLARAAAPEEIASVVRFLALEAPEFLCGQCITVDGGQTIRGATL